jgi:type VI secretion system protein VasD
MRRCALFVAAVPLSLSLIACGSSTPDPTPVTVQIQTADNINPDAFGQAAPVVVRVYLLQKKDTFTSSEFNALYLRDKQALAADLVSSQEFELQPGKEATFTTKDAQAATELGILAAYRDVANAQWRAVVELKPHEDSNVFIARIKLGSISIEPKPSGGWFSWL